MKPSPSAVRRRSEGGGAALVALIALSALALLGLSLGFVTQTEMLIGTSEKNIQRVHYLAESGLSLAVARLLVRGEREAVALTMRDAPLHAGGVVRGQRLLLAPTLPVTRSPCNLCQVNGASQYSGEAFYDVRNTVTVRATLRADGASGDRRGAILAERNLHAFVDVLPTRDAVPPSHLPPSQLGLVRVNPGGLPAEGG